MNELNICSYNCCSLKKNIDVIREITSKNTYLIFLQETFISDDDLGIINFIDENYGGIGVGAKYSEKSIVTASGRPMGGLVCLYRKQDNLSINLVYHEDDFMVVNVTYNDKTMIFINTYIRSDLNDPLTLNEYLNSLHKIQLVLDDIDCNSVYICGDFNADPFCGRAWSNLSDFMRNNYFTCFDVDILDESTFTHISFSHAYCKWLDHFIGRSYDNITIDHVRVLYDLIGSDHLPLHVCMKLPYHDSVPREKNYNDNTDDTFYLNWSSLNKPDIDFICGLACQIQGDFYINNDVTSCFDVGCSDDVCKCKIDDMYNNLVNSFSSSLHSFFKLKVSNNKHKIIPGWNINVKQLYSVSRSKYLLWLYNGKPRNGILFDDMKSSRSEFKKALKDCKLNENHEILLSIEEKFKLKSMKNFWKEVKKRKGIKSSVDTINGKSENYEILNIFNEIFLTDNGVDPTSCSCEGLISQRWDQSVKQYPLLSNQSVTKLIKKLNVGTGHDLIHTNILLNANSKLTDNLTAFLNCCLVHCYLPKDLLRGDISPIIKNDKMNKTDASNYRPVMQSSNLLKIFELFFVDILEEKIILDSRQFGFKKNSSTTDACFLLKETVHNYISANSTVFAAFIDLSKAFDRVDHDQLLKILLNDFNIPIDLVKILCSYLKNQSGRIKWKQSFGDYFDIRRGVRQGGILSPFLFKVYLNGVINSIVRSQIGCQLGFTRVNIIAYTNDFVILADSVKNLIICYISFIIQ